MSNYVKSTDFAAKDALASGNAGKIVKGTEIDTEFNNIATAVATKADLASPTFTGTPALPTGTTAVTQTSTDDSTKLATTAFVQDVADSVASAVKNALYPVGSIYVNATNNANPGTLLGFGTWSAFGAGRVLIGDGGGFSAGSTGGSADAIVVSHTHSITDSGHQHNIPTVPSGIDGSNAIGNSPFASTLTKTTNTATTGISINSTGSSGTNANLQPYIVVYMWQRTA